MNLLAAVVAITFTLPAGVNKSQIESLQTKIEGPDGIGGWTLLFNDALPYDGVADEINYFVDLGGYGRVCVEAILINGQSGGDPVCRPVFDAGCQ